MLFHVSVDCHPWIHIYSQHRRSQPTLGREAHAAVDAMQAVAACLLAVLLLAPSGSYWLHCKSAINKQQQASLALFS